MTHTTSRRSAFSLPLFLMLGACSAADPAAPFEPGEANEAASGYGSAVVLATLEVSDQQTIEILEYPEGIMGIVERQGPEFDPAVALTMADFRGKSLAEFYERLAGAAVDKGVLEKLRAHRAVADAALAEQPAHATAVTEVTADSVAPADLEATGVGEAPESSSGIRTLSHLACFQSASVYETSAAAWASVNCNNPPSWENWWCKTNAFEAIKGWTHGERYMIRLNNMSQCNTARIRTRAGRGGSAPLVLLDHSVGPSAHYWYWWEVSNRDWQWYTSFKHETGPESAHLNLATYRQW